MRGGFVHNHVLLAPLEELFVAHGASVHREYLVTLKNGCGFMDSFVRFGCWRIACEAELCPKRVPNDMAKAIAAHAHWLLILTPRPQVATACARRLDAKPIPHSLTICFLTVGTAREWFAQCLPLLTGANQFSKTNH